MKTIAAAALIASTFAFSAFCQEEAPPSDVVHPEQQWAGWSFQEENDVLTKTNTDKYYTQGLRFTKTRNPAKNPQQIKDFSHWFLVHFNNGLNAAPPIWTIGLGQNIYTPDDITISTPQLNDRHWGGFLYIDNQLQIVAKNESARHLFEAQTGVVGSYSAARWAQTTLHKLIGSAKPQGWSNQLKNEPAANLIYSYDRRLVCQHCGVIDADFLPHAGGSLGTVMTYANAGGVVRIGKNNTGFLNGALRASAFTNFDGTRPRWEFWVYGGAEGRAVAHNIFLSGGFFQQIPTEIETKHFVYDVLTGASLRYRRWRLTYNMVRRSSEFSHPFAAGSGRQQFGSVLFSVEPILPRK